MEREALRLVLHPLEPLSTNDGKTSIFPPPLQVFLARTTNRFGGFLFQSHAAPIPEKAIGSLQEHQQCELFETLQLSCGPGLRTPMLEIDVFWRASG